MIHFDRAPWAVQPAVRRLSSLAPLNAEAMALLDAAISTSAPVRARHELLKEGRTAGQPLIIVSGWAARVRLLAEGRRLFLGFLLPGDLVGWCPQPRPLATSTVTALTDVLVCCAPDPAATPALAEAYATSGALEQAHLLGQIVRLGGMNAQERIADLMLELHERLRLAGLVALDTFDMPLTQEGMADAIGLTSVHVNRMVQLMRREGDLQWKGKRVTLPDPAALARKFRRVAPRVSADIPVVPG